MDLIAIGVIALGFALWLSLPRREKQDPPPEESTDWAWPPR